MMRDNYTNFFKTKDNQNIFYSTNFKLDEEINTNVLIFNYGLVCSNHHWQEQIKFFDDLGYKILIHDYRGHYQSTGKDKVELITFEQISRDLFSLLNHLKIKDSIFLGHSMGVNICLEFAKRHTEICKAMVLISGTTVPVYDIMFNSNIVDQIQPILKKLLESYPSALSTFWKYGGWNPIVKKLIHKGGFNIEEVSEEFIEIYLNKVGELGPEIFFQLLEQMNNHSILANIETISTPSLIVGGDNDKVIPNYLQRFLHKSMKESELYIVRNGRHVPQVDFHLLVNERLKTFIDKVII